MSTLDVLRTPFCRGTLVTLLDAQVSSVFNFGLNSCKITNAYRELDTIRADINSTGGAGSILSGKGK